MNLKNWVKDKFKSSKPEKEIDYNKYNDPLLNKSWIEHYFAIQINIPDMKPTELDIQFSYIAQDWLNKIYSAVLEVPEIKKLNVPVPITRNYLSEILKSMTTKCYDITDLPPEYSRVLQYRDINHGRYFLLIRFPDITQKEADTAFNGTHFRFSPPNKKRNYKFTPLQSLHFFDYISKKIEWQIVVMTGERIKPQEIQTLITGEDKDVIINEFDGLQYYYYPLSRRAELYSKFPELEIAIFGLPFPEYAKWIIDKENDSEYMKRNAERTRQILKKYKL